MLNTTIFANDEVGHSGEEDSLCNDRFRHIFMELYEVYRSKHLRARVVEHPTEWEWCGYNEIIGKRKRFCLLDIPEILLQSLCSSLKELRTTYISIIDEALSRRDFSRDRVWTESSPLEVNLLLNK